MEDIEVRYSIPEPKRIKDKKTGKWGYKIYNYSWYENGKRRKNDTHFHTNKKECIDEARLRISGNADIVSNQKKVTIKGLINLYREYLYDTNDLDIAPSTKRGRYDNCNSLIKYTPESILKTRLINLDVEGLKTWLNHLKNKARLSNGNLLSAQYYDRLRNLIKLILEYADSQNYFSDSMERYTSLLHWLREDKPRATKEKREFRYLTFDEFKRFASSCLYDANIEEEEDVIANGALWLFGGNKLYLTNLIKYQNYVYFVFFCCMFFLGTRAEECRVLTWDDIDYNAGNHEGRITIDKAYTANFFKKDTEEYLKEMPTKTKGSTRRIPIHPDLKVILECYKEYLIKNDLLTDRLFPGVDNGYLSYGQINHKIERVLANIGMKDKKFSKHDFRRSCAMYLCYELNLPKENAIWFFGWTNTDMLNQVYARFNDIQRSEKLEEELNKVGFFKREIPAFYYEDGKLITGEKAKEKVLHHQQNEYQKYYNGTAKRKGDEDEK